MFNMIPMAAMGGQIEEMLKGMLTCPKRVSLPGGVIADLTPGEVEEFQIRVRATPVIRDLLDAVHAREEAFQRTKFVGERGFDEAFEIARHTLQLNARVTNACRPVAEQFVAEIAGRRVAEIQLQKAREVAAAKAEEENVQRAKEQFGDGKGD